MADENIHGTVTRRFNDVAIGQRLDGYLNATAMCRANGRKWKHYNENDGTREFVAELSRSVGIPTDRLIVSITTGPNAGRGTWVHPQIGYHLAQWCSPAFAVKVTEWILEIATKGYATAHGIDAVNSGGLSSLTADEAQVIAHMRQMTPSLRRRLLLLAIAGDLKSAGSSNAPGLAALPPPVPEPPFCTGCAARATWNARPDVRDRARVCPPALASLADIRQFPLLSGPITAGELELLAAHRLTLREALARYSDEVVAATVNTLGQVLGRNFVLKDMLTPGREEDSDA